MENRYCREASSAAATRLLMSSILPKRISAGLEASAMVCLLRHSGRSANGLHDLRRQAEAHMLGHHFHLAHVGEALLSQEINSLLHQYLGGRGAGGQADRVHVFQPLRLDRAAVLD